MLLLLEVLLDLEGQSEIHLDVVVHHPSRHLTSHVELVEVRDFAVTFSTLLDEHDCWHLGSNLFD